MLDDLKNAITEFKKAKSVCIFSSEVNTVDKAVSMVALAKICVSEKKSFQIICPKNLRTPIKTIFEKEGLEVSSDLSTKDYVVSVDYRSANIEKVVCKKDEDGKRLNFVITPKDDLFNFDNVELISGGASFDLIFAFGARSLDDSIKEVLEKSKIVSFSKKESDFGTFKFLINGKRSYSEVVYEFVKAFSRGLSEETLNILLQGIISKYKLLENGNNDGWVLVTKFIKYGADFNKAFRSLNYSKDYANLELQKKVMENLRLNTNARVIWSKVALMLDVNSSNIDLRGRIIFNISKEFDLAFVIYHMNKENVKVVVESNDTNKYSALDLGKVFSGHGSKSRAIFTNKDIPADEFEKKFFDALRKVFDLDV